MTTVEGVFELISDSTPVEIIKVNEDGEEVLVYEDGDIWPYSLYDAYIDFICADFPEYGVVPIIKIYIK